MIARSAYRRIAFAAALVAASLLVNSPAGAHEHGRGRREGHHRRGAVVVAPAPVYAPVPVFATPRIIATAQIPAYRSYFAGDAYYAPHHHAHVVYRFPVETVHGIVYRPFTYCGDRLFAPRGTAVYVAAPSYDDGVSGFVQLGGPNFRIAFGF